MRVGRVISLHRVLRGLVVRHRLLGSLLVVGEGFLLKIGLKRGASICCGSIRQPGFLLVAARHAVGFLLHLCLQGRAVVQRAHVPGRCVLRKTRVRGIGCLLQSCVEAPLLVGCARVPLAGVLRIRRVVLRHVVRCQHVLEIARLLVGGVQAADVPISLLVRKLSIHGPLLVGLDRRLCLLEIGVIQTCDWQPLASIPQTLRPLPPARWSAG